jgi:CheY-like chemotaxis protein
MEIGMGLNKCETIKMDGKNYMGLKVAKDYLTGKRVLIVDDEEDVLDSLEDLLTMCKVMKASSFEEAKNLLMNGKFHLAILDIMGVDGYELLRIANERDVIAVMLTARALSVEDTKKSFKEGAASYLPKDKLAEIATFLNDVLEAQIKGESFWWRWYFRLGPYYDKRFGPDWQDEDRSFWDKFREFAGME